MKCCPRFSGHYILTGHVILTGNKVLETIKLNGSETAKFLASLPDRKYEMIKVSHGSHKELFQLKALRDFSDVKTGDLGGFVEDEYTLSHAGSCWIYNPQTKEN